MASITLGTFRDYLKAVADWANGLKEPKVQISGSLLQDGTELLTNADSGATGPGVSVSGMSTAIVRITGSIRTGHFVRLECSPDGGLNWYLADAYEYVSSVPMPVTGTPMLLVVDIAGVSHLRARVLGPGTGSSITAKLYKFASPFVPNNGAFEWTPFNALAITDTEEHASSTLFGLGIRELVLEITNTHNASLWLRITREGSGNLFDANGSQNALSVPAGITRRVYRAVDAPMLNGPFPIRFQLRVAAQTSPTTGALTIVARAVPF